MDDLTTLAVVMLAGAALTALIGFPLAMLDNPQRRRKNRQRRTP